jgi:hypothetical protein
MLWDWHHWSAEVDAQFKPIWLQNSWFLHYPSCLSIFKSSCNGLSYTFHVVFILVYRIILLLLLLLYTEGCWTFLTDQMTMRTVIPWYPRAINFRCPSNAKIWGINPLIQNDIAFAYNLPASIHILFTISRLVILLNVNSMWIVCCTV